MRIIPIQIEIDLYDLWRGVFADRPDWMSSYNTLMLNVFYFDGPNTTTSLLEIGWYQGKFHFEIFYTDWIKWKYQEWKENR